MINAIRFAPLGEQRVDQRELDAMKESFSETMGKFGYTPEQTKDALERLETEAMQAAAREREP